MSRSTGFFLLVIAGWLITASCSSAKNASFDSSYKIAPDKMQSDVVLLKKVLEADHPSLYWYTSKDSLDLYFNTALYNLNDSLTEFEFKNRVAWLVSKIKCGHTSVHYPRSYNKYFRHSKLPFLPLYVKTWNDSIVVVANAFPRDSVLKRGTVITSINGYTNKVLLDSIFSFISTDGYSENFKSQLCSFNFPAFYYNAFGKSDKFTIGYIDSTGLEKTTVVNAYERKRDTSTKKNSNNVKILPPSPPRKTFPQYINAKKNIQFDTANGIAYMRLATFSNNANLKSFYKKSFKKLRKHGINSLVIDLRENGGGNISNSIRLTKYLIDKPFKVADTVAAVSKNIAYKKYISPGIAYWFAMQFTTHKKDDGRAHYTYYENNLFKPKKKNHFTGQVYLLQGGFTFSAATMFVNSLKGQNNITVVGEETGGGSYGNSAVYLPTLVLPNSKLRVTFPLYRVVIDHSKEKAGRGIIPDVLIPPSSLAIQQGVDIKMQAILQMIHDKKEHLAGKLSAVSYQE
ncbi:S41 family peptidase [Danxiaibacter flavus]|uniref:S41 family peptidase n=1 Tax=Danxiaibacter flavus TaxID=3049108 RepID=A0ABV3ZFV4_9BACT|nr:S41 family peptidase [Chitinophagaceae bacterium DXS]